MLQPGYRFGIEVVGRLIEQQQVGFGQQQPAQCHAPALTTGQRRHVSVALRASERVHRHFDLAVQIPGAQRLDLVLQFGLLVVDGFLFGSIGRLAESVPSSRCIGRSAPGSRQPLP